MGYVNVTDISHFIPPTMIAKTAGTWTKTHSSGLVYDARTAADAEFTLMVPLIMPGSSIGLQGAKLTKISYWYRIQTAAMDDIATVKLYALECKASGSAPAATEITGITIDTDHDTGAERKTAAYHKMEITIDTPFFLDQNYLYYLVIVVDGSALGVFWDYGAQVDYTLRI